MNSFEIYTKKSPCPLCGQHDGCRSKSDHRGTLHFCRHSLPGDHPALIYLGESTNGTAGLFHKFLAPRDGATPITHTHKIAPITPIAPTLDSDDRDRVYRAVLGDLSLCDQDRDDLLARGLSAEQIEYRGYRSITPDHRLDTPLPAGLPGAVNWAGKNKLTVTAPGYLCPVVDHAGLITALTLRKRDPGDSGRYQMVSNRINPLGSPFEIPLHIARGDDPSGAIYLSEGLGPKPQVLAGRYPCRAVIGAGGGNWLSSPVLLKEALQSLGAKPGDTIKLSPDSQWYGNDKVLPKIDALAEWFHERGYNFAIAWVGTDYALRKGKDLDEFEPENIEFLALPDAKSRCLKTSQKQHFDSLEWLTKTPDTSINSRYLSSENIAPYLGQDGLFFVASAMGSGKTDSVIRAAVEHAVSRGLRVLWIGSRVSLTSAMCAKFGAHFVNDLQRQNPDHLSKVGCVIDSLFKAGRQPYHLVVIDEVESVLSHALLSNTCRDKRQELLNRFRVVLSQASQILCLDANLSDPTVDFLESFTKQKSILIRNNHPPKQRKIELVAGGKRDQVDSFWVRIRGDILTQAERVSKGERPDNIVMVVSDSQGSLEHSHAALSDQLLSEYQGDLSQIFDEIRLKYGDHVASKIVRIDRKTSQEGDSTDPNSLSPVSAKYLMAHPNYTRDFDPIAVFISPSAFQGLSFDDHRIKRVYGHFRGVVESRDSVQALARARESYEWVILASDSYHLGLQAHGKTGTQEVLDYLLAEQASLDLENVDLIAPELVSLYADLGKQLSLDEAIKMLEDRHKKITDRVDYPLLYLKAQLIARRNYCAANFAQCLKARLEFEGHEFGQITESLSAENWSEAKDFGKHKAKVKEAILMAESTAISEASKIIRDTWQGANSGHKLTACEAKYHDAVDTLSNGLSKESDRLVAAGIKLGWEYPMVDWDPDSVLDMYVKNRGFLNALKLRYAVCNPDQSLATAAKKRAKHIVRSEENWLTGDHFDNQNNSILVRAIRKIVGDDLAKIESDFEITDTLAEQWVLRYQSRGSGKLTETQKAVLGVKPGHKKQRGSAKRFATQILVKMGYKLAHNKGKVTVSADNFTEQKMMLWDSLSISEENREQVLSDLWGHQQSESKISTEPVSTTQIYRDDLRWADIIPAIYEPGWSLDSQRYSAYERVTIAAKNGDLGAIEALRLEGERIKVWRDELLTANQPRLDQWRKSEGMATARALLTKVGAENLLSITFGQLFQVLTAIDSAMIDSPAAMSA